MASNIIHSDDRRRSTDGMPEGTYLIHFNGDSLLEIGVTFGGDESARLVWDRHHIGVGGVWARTSFWRYAIVPGTAAHENVVTFLAAAHLGVVDRTLLGWVAHARP